MNVCGKPVQKPLLSPVAGQPGLRFPENGPLPSDSRHVVACGRIGCAPVCGRMRRSCAGTGDDLHRLTRLEGHQGQFAGQSRSAHRGRQLRVHRRRTAARSSRKLIHELTSGQRSASDPDPYGPLADVHVAVVSLGLAGVAALDAGCRADGGDNGALQHRRTRSDCQTRYPDFLAYVGAKSVGPLTDPETIEHDVGCIGDRRQQRLRLRATAGSRIQRAAPEHACRSQRQPRLLAQRCVRWLLGHREPARHWLRPTTPIRAVFNDKPCCMT